MATPLQMQFTEEDFKEAGSYDELVDGEDYIATLLAVKDIEASTGNTGWGFEFDVKGLKITTRLWHRGGGKWKIREVFNALGAPIEPGDGQMFLDPNSLIGNQCVVTIKKEARDDGEGYWTNIGRHVPYVAEETADFGEL